MYRTELTPAEQTLVATARKKLIPWPKKPKKVRSRYSWSGFLATFRTLLGLFTISLCRTVKAASLRVYLSFIEVHDEGAEIFHNIGTVNLYIAILTLVDQSVKTLEWVILKPGDSVVIEERCVHAPPYCLEDGGEMLVIKPENQPIRRVKINDTRGKLPLAA